MSAGRQKRLFRRAEAVVRVRVLAKWHLVAAALGMAVSLPWYAIAQEETASTPPDQTDERVVLEADYVYEIRDENKLVAEGNVEALYQGRVLRADKLVYDRNTEKVRASGNVIIIDETGSQQFAQEIEVDSRLSDGYAIGFSARLAEGATVAEAAPRASAGRFRAIFLTSLTTLLGLLPILSETSLQAQILIPLVTSLAFGLLSSTVLVLGVIPALYTILDDLGLSTLARERRAASMAVAEMG